jgi:tetratricopeptide (TPR) repeat protein
LYYCHLKLGNSNSLIFYGQLAVEHIHLDSKTKCKIYSSIGRFYLLTYLETFKTSNLIKGISSSTDAIELYKALNYEPVNDYIDCLYDCGELCFYINDYDLSLKYYEDILNFSSSLTISSNILFGVYSNLSHIYHVKGYKETEQYYNKKLLEIESKY